ncbi:YbgA family protein, partial [Streptococcus dysgalactiae subsp. dysgalactiae]|nr:YbgA family protein [Streptococcus dysgalactiae subsp. dysgalactiae]
GYFKKVASQEEKEHFKDLDAQLEIRSEEMLYFLQEMTAHYQPSYLLSCRLITTGP